MERRLFNVPGLQVSAGIKLDLPKHCSFELSLTEDTEPFSVQISEMPYLDFVGLGNPEVSAGLTEVMKSGAHWGDPDETTVVELSSASGFWWMKNWVITSLRLFAPGDIRHGSDVFIENDGRTLLLGNEFHHHPGSRDEVLDAAAVRRLGGHLASCAGLPAVVRGSSALSIALRYFLRSYEGRWLRNDHGHSAGSYRDVPLEDIVLQLTIALEAMFCTESTEVAYRMRTRCARLIAADDDEARLIDSLCRWAYEVRSRVAHGSFEEFTAKGGHMRFLAEGELQDYQFHTMRLRHLVRRSILAVATILHEGWTLDRLLGALDAVLPGGADLAAARARGTQLRCSSSWPTNPRGPGRRARELLAAAVADQR